jgi:hypothetical protein
VGQPKMLSSLCAKEVADAAGPSRSHTSTGLEELPADTYLHVTMKSVKYVNSKLYDLLKKGSCLPAPLPCDDYSVEIAQSLAL